MILRTVAGAGSVARSASNVSQKESEVGTRLRILPGGAVSTARHVHQDLRMSVALELRKSNRQKKPNISHVDSYSLISCGLTQPQK